MRSVRNMKHHSYIFFFFFFFLVLIQLPVRSISVNTLSSTESLTISSNRTLASPGNDFELGFFKPSSNSRWYLGIWYKKVPDTTHVWVANRDKPITNSIGTLKILDINLVLLDHTNKLVWSTNLTKRDVKSHVVAELLDNGNFVLKDSNKNKNNNDPDRFFWQSFDFPTDTLLPEMKLGWDLKTGINRFLIPWRSFDDPSSGDFSYKLETIGFPQFYTWKLDFRVHRSGPWDGTQFGGMPEIHSLNYMIYNFTYNNEEIAYTFVMTNRSIYSRLTLIPSGDLQRSVWIPISWGWKVFWSAPIDECDVYQICGSYSYCDSTTTPICNCIKGFTPLSPTSWAMRDGSDGCVRKTPLSCNGDGFVRLKRMKLPASMDTIVDRSIGLKECKQRCLKDCNCTAFANTDIRNGGSGCVIWIDELMDMRNYADKGPDLYVRLADVDLEKKINIGGKVKGLIIGFSVVLFVSLLMFCFWKWKQKRARARAIEAPIVNQESTQDSLLSSTTQFSEDDDDTDDFKLPMIDFEAVVIATDNFSDSNKLGKGGFGIVYKGRLVNGQEIAVKRLSVTSNQGITEFKNEVKLIARLQHINLVRLLACCVYVDEKLLIYEYLENLSLDSFIFDKTRSYKLDWKTRLEIINGIARGLLYLHQDSRFRIIHRDLKTSNILLDKNMIPKISDFGMARIIEGDQTEANTVKIVGTYGYMSPEYAMDGFYSIKSDVYSFGVLLLEIVTGKKNWKFSNSSGDLNLLGYVWRKWKEGKEIEIIDPAMAESLISFQEFQRCIQIGLLCVQKFAEDRPTMSGVVLMLGSETTVIPKPQFPGHSIVRSCFEETDSSSSSSQLFTEEYSTVNQLTVSRLLPR